MSLELGGTVKTPSSTRKAIAEALELRRLFATVLWDGGGNGTSWSDALNWSTDALPTAFDDVIIPTTTAAGVTLQSAQPTSIRSLTIGDGVNSASFTLFLGELVVSAPTTVHARAHLRLSASADIGGNQGVMNHGLIELFSGAITGPMDNFASVVAQQASIGRYRGATGSLLRVEATTGTGASAGLSAAGGLETAGDIILTNVANSLGTNAAATITALSGPLNLLPGGAISALPGPEVPGQYTIVADSAQIDGPISVAATTRLNLDGQGDWNGAGNVLNHGTLTLPFGAFTVPIDNAGTLLCTKPGVQVLGPFNSRVDSLIRIQAGANQANVTAGFYNGLVNRGRIELDSVFAKVPTLSVTNGVLTNEATGTIIAQTNGGGFPPGTIPPDRIIQGSVLNRGLMTLEVSIFGELANQLRVTSNVVNEGVINVTGSTTFYGGFLPLELQAGGRLSGNGTVVGSVRNSSGVVEPGDIGVIGSLRLEGNYVQESAGTFMHDFANSSRDQFTVTGSISIAGAAGFRPISFARAEAITDIQMITAASATGAFDTVASIIQTNGVIVGARVTSNSALRTASPIRPALPDLAPASDSGTSNTDNITRNTQIQIQGIADRAATFELYEGATLLASGPVVSSAYSTNILLTEGVHLLRARAADAAGDISDFSTNLTLTIDLTAPVQLSADFDFETGQTMSWRFNESMPIAALPQVANLDNGTTLPASSITAIATDPDRTSFRIAVGAPDGNYLATPAPTTADIAGNTAESLAPLPFFIFRGDANRDRTIDIADFAIVSGRFNQPGTFSQGNFDYDGSTGIGDFAILASKFNTSLPAPSIQRKAANSAGRTTPWAAMPRRDNLFRLFSSPPDDQSWQ